MQKGDNMRKWMTVAVLAGGLAMAGGGCDDGDGGNGNTDGGGGGVSSGLAPTKPVNTLTPGEVTQLCKAMEDAVNAPAVSDSLCKFLSVVGAGVAATFVPATTEAQLRMSCTTGYDECKKEPARAIDCGASAPACTATVAEVEKCLSDETAAVIALGASVPACAALTKAALNTPPSTDPLEEIASCKSLDQKCPDLIPEPELD
jgi:hypothetical protein